MSRLKNIFTIDLEDWFCSHNLQPFLRKNDWNNLELRVVDSTRIILKLLRKYRAEATFFVLGWIAEKVPSLIREIEDDGHEIASHGYSHTLITSMSPQAFREDLAKSLEVTEPLIKTPIRGFRAPAFTITNQTSWALPILKEFQFTYDSSIYPIGFHPDYGMPESPLEIYDHTCGIVEIPLSCAVIAGKRIPCSGGGYFRLFPYFIFRQLLNLCNEQKRPVVFYLHPWELDPFQPRIQLPMLTRFRHYNNLHTVSRKLERLLSDFEFTSVRNLMENTRTCIQQPMINIA